MDRDLRWFTNHTLDTEGARTNDHETLLEFTNSEANSAFLHWWLNVGFESYKEWALSNLEELTY